MYKKLKATNPDSDEFEAHKINLRTYNEILKRNIKIAKSDYYQASFSNQSLKTGIFPERLKIAKVTPIYKKDDVKMFENYRPISIIPAIILEETTPHNMQPSSSLTELYSTWTKTKFLSAFFIDLSKAFDN